MISDRKRASDKQYRKRNAAKVAERNKQWYENNKARASATSRAWAKANPDKIKAKSIRNKTRVSSIARLLFGAASRRSAEYRIPFALTIEWVRSKIEAGACAATGHRFLLEPGSPWRPSIDRLDPSRGYVPDNCQVVCCIYNFAKHDYQHSDVLELARCLVGKEGSE